MQVIGFPAIVKPVNGGFSLGVSCVTNFAELPAAIEMALKEDTQFLVESFITGREIAIGVMRTANGIIALPACEVRSKNGFISHQDKISASFEKIVPAALTIDEQQKLNDIAKKIYQLFECKGVIRVDFILKNDGRAFLLEINTVPGMASLSIIPAAVKTLGWTLEYFFTQLIENAPIS
jgi:D-alanine-D-alanine ligase